MGPQSTHERKMSSSPTMNSWRGCGRGPSAKVGIIDCILAAFLNMVVRAVQRKRVPRARGEHIPTQPPIGFELRLVMRGPHGGR